MCQNIMYFPRRTLRTLCAHATAAAAVTTVLPSDMTSLVVCPSKSAPQSNRRRRGGYLACQYLSVRPRMRRIEFPARSVTSLSRGGKRIESQIAVSQEKLPFTL